MKDPLEPRMPSIEEAMRPVKLDLDSLFPAELLNGDILDSENHDLSSDGEEL